MNKILRLKYIFLITTLFAMKAYAVSDTIFIRNHEFEVNATNSSNIIIHVGQSVVFKWVSGDHPIASDNNTWSTFTLNSANPTKTLTFNTAGSFPYHCTLHSGMKGTITVSQVDGISESKAKYELTIVPDSYDNQITFNLNSGSKTIRGLRVFDIIGKEVAYVDLTGRSGTLSYTVNFAHLKPGIYMCSVYSDKGIVETKRFIWN